MSSEWNHASWVSTLGKFAWLIGLINGILGILWGLFTAISAAAIPFGLGASLVGWGIWIIIGGILTAVISVVIILPKFSSKCAAKDWDSLYGWTLKLGSTKIPWMLIWGILLEIFSWWWWGGIAVLLPALFLIFAGPKPYDWKS